MSEPPSPAVGAEAVTVVGADEQTAVDVDVDRWCRLAAAVLTDEGCSGELTLTFVDREVMAELNLEFMGTVGPTDVLSFPLDAVLDAAVPDAAAEAPGGGGVPDRVSSSERRGPGRPGREKAVVPDRVSTSGRHDPGPAGRHDPFPRLLGDVAVCPEVAVDQAPEHAGVVDDELALLVVHGVLHVLGHDHAVPDETALMRARELDHLRRHHWDGSVPTAFRQEHES